MDRPEIRTDINDGYTALNEYTIRLEKYCDHIEQKVHDLQNEVYFFVTCESLEEKERVGGQNNVC
jgi:hypothetical protein